MMPSSGSCPEKALKLVWIKGGSSEPLGSKAKEASSSLISGKRKFHTNFLIEFKSEEIAEEIAADFLQNPEEISYVIVTFLYSDYIAKMASFTMTASILGSPAVTNRSAVATQRRSLVVNAAKAVEAEKVSYDNDMDGSNGRRNLMFAAAAAAVCSVAGMAVADEPKPGTPEAKKKYAPICVTMPTARICRN
ncbi:Photosystem II 5 kDa protein, chloroplastic [Glycine soja]|nr:Photosystem II 5 kDa protein, chloroplastic [Glycine soja]